jgi:hypothetical protein
VDHQARWLIQDQEIHVFIEDRKRDLLGLGLCRDRGGECEDIYRT